jgi:hypothetical protein
LQKALWRNLILGMRRFREFVVLFQNGWIPGRIPEGDCDADITQSTSSPRYAKDLHGPN